MLLNYDKQVLNKVSWDSMSYLWGITTKEYIVLFGIKGVNYETNNYHKVKINFVYWIVQNEEWWMVKKTP